MTYYCWHCYGENHTPKGRCVVCGRELEPPPGTDYVEQLLWALRHPLPDRRLVAAQVLGQRRERRAREALRDLVEGNPDPYLAAQALWSLVAIDDAEAHRGLLERLAREGAPAVKRVARDALSNVGNTTEW